VKSVDAELLAADSNILSSQHSSVWGRLVTVCLDLHASGDTADGFAATGITQMLAYEPFQPSSLYIFGKYEPGIGDVDEGVVETGEDTGNAEDEFSCRRREVSYFAGKIGGEQELLEMGLPSRTFGPREIFSWAGRAAFFGGIFDLW